MPKAMLAARDTIHTDVTSLTNQFGQLCLPGYARLSLERSRNKIRSLCVRLVVKSQAVSAPQHQRIWICNV